MAYSQNERIGTVACALGSDALLLRRLSGLEAISAPFEFDLELASEQVAIDFRSLIGSSLTVRIETEQGSPRFLNGIVVHLSQLGTDERLTYYRARIVPWLWLLTQRTDCRIFQNLSVPDIVKQVFRERGFTDFSDRLQGSYDPRVYCVQYRESDFDFVSRLLEESGIGFFFLHEEKRHTLVLFDTRDGNPPSVQAEATCVSERDRLRTGNVWSWELGRDLRTGAFALTDYDFEQPSTDLMVSAATSEPLGGNEALESYDYPGRYERIVPGDRRVRTRLERTESASFVSWGQSDCAHFLAGSHFQLQGHARPDFNQHYLITRVTHHFEQSLVGDDMLGVSYENSIECLPHTIAYRPPSRTPKPVVHGVQTAVVVGPAGQEIHVDALGRVKVQFHWDRLGQRDERSSCWVRVSQPWAGKGWGGMAIPRIGQEVIVDFIEGDPDRPIITGRVYNAEQVPPYALPAGANLTGIRSNSTPGGGGFNEIVLDDTKGSEQVRVHAQHDMSTEVENDQTLHVKHNRTELVDQVYQVTGKVRIQILSEQSSITIDPTHIELHSGSGTIVLDAEGVRINGSLIKLNS